MVGPSTACGPTAAPVRNTLLSAVESPTQSVSPVPFGPARILAAESFAHAVLPSEAEEVWRYSRINDLDLGRYRGAVSSADHLQVSLPRSAIDAGVVVLRGEQAGASGLFGSLLADDLDALTLLAVSMADDVVLIDIPAGVTVAEPILLTRHLVSDGATIPSRLFIRAGANSEATVIERLTSADVASLAIPLTELLVEHAARLRTVSVQELGPKMWQVGTTVASTGGDATLSTMAVALGGSYARLRIDATVTAKGGHNELMAVYFGEGSQMHDFRTMQHHLAPRTTSDLLFKGAVEDRAQSVYTGLIHISKDGRGTSANQTNRNLVLSPNASAESVPNLEIDNNDVKCSHASAIGPIDDEHRYYLESRGVPPEVAERMIVQGFFADLLGRIPDEQLRDQLIDAVRAKFDRRGAQ
jgi:Fe-S cluster assembly protein SufD